ncbi:MAG: bifunctional 3-(3-hydroxy-phenyl)propionate/3-hydroxycinnamic acid hydroxylase [Amylibacter sp.]
MNCDVCIIGAGPVGMLLGNLLGRRGISVAIIEKQPKPYNLPRAVHFDGEAMRVFQGAGLAEAVLPHTMVGRGMLFKDTHDNVVVDWSRDQEIGPMGWYESNRCHQPGIEDALRVGLDRFDHVSLYVGVAVGGVSQDDDGVSVRLSDGREVRSKYAVGADGANSFVRSTLGISVDDLGFKEDWLVVDLILKRPRPDLGDYSVQFCDPVNSATYVRGVGDRRRWELRLPVDRMTDPDEAEIWQRLSRWITPTDAELERDAVYTFRSCVVEKWRQGRVFLAGDAAHQMPPFMGQGMCAGIRDVANLNWKLAQVLDGGEDVLETYESEREPHIRQFIELTVSLGKLINQTAAGETPKGKMQSIWPELGAGLGCREGVGGALAPQVRVDGVLADDVAKQGFYVLAATQVESALPVVVGAQDWLADHDVGAVVVRPDGYVLEAFEA